MSIGGSLCELSRMILYCFYLVEIMNPDIKPEKIAVITRNYYYYPYIYNESQDELISTINHCDKLGYDTILFSPWSVPLNLYSQLNHRNLFKNKKNIINIIFEFANIPENDDFSSFTDNATVLLTHDDGRFDFKQQLAYPPTSDKTISDFYDQLDRRIFGNVLILLCGEINMSGIMLKNGEIDDKYNFINYLDSSPVKLILNPIHTYMGSTETIKKRLAIAGKERALLSYWNQYDDEHTVTTFSNEVTFNLPHTELKIKTNTSEYMLTTY